MKSFELSIPGKTFVAGEYLALTGQPALVVGTEPRFTLAVTEGAADQNPFHPASPGGQLWSQHQDFFSRFELVFQDPYQIGGFGASTAQFALLHGLYQLQEKRYVEAERFYDWHRMLGDYRSLKCEGAPPSGADLIGMVAGRMTWFDRNNGKIQTFGWPFQETEFFLAHTGQKLATHEHLKALGSFETEALKRAMTTIHQGLTQIDFNLFVEGLKAYRGELRSQAKEAAYTGEKVRKLEESPEVIFAKGCGALGSDVIFVLSLKKNSEKTRSLLEQNQLKVIADSSQIAVGLQIRNLNPVSGEVTL
jgi:mevalonate kinase